MDGEFASYNDGPNLVCEEEILLLLLVRRQVIEVFLKTYFDQLDDVVIKNDLENKTSQIYNCDESSMPL